MSVANAWASADALSMVTWFNHQIVVGQCLVTDMDLLFEYVHPSIETLLLPRVLIMNFQIVSLIFCHSALHKLFGQ